MSALCYTAIHRPRPLSTTGSARRPWWSFQAPFTLDVTTGRGIAIHRMGHTVGLLREDP
jgi:hypothetical protein